MTMQTLQGSFTSGELSPSLAARVDLAKYNQGCRTLKNMLVQPHGGAVKRPGFLLLDELPGDAWLVPFVFNTEQSYMLVFGEGWLRVATVDGFVLNTSGVPYHIESPYTLEQAKKLSYAQSADVLFLAHGAVRPHRLKRFGHADWRFEPISFNSPVNAPYFGGSEPLASFVLDTANKTFGLRHIASHETIPSYFNLYRKTTGSVVLGTGYAVIYSAGTLEYINGDYSVLPYDLYQWVSGQSAVGVRFANDAKDSSGNISPAQLVTPYSYFVTAVDVFNNESGTGVGTEIMGPASNNWQSGDYMALSWTAVPGAVEYRVYKAEFGGRAGYIGSTTKTAYLDYNASPVLSDGPPQWTDPFLDDDYPSVVCFFEQRLVFASSPKRPQTIWMSKTGDYDNFSACSPLKADDSLELTIASNEVSPMMWMVPLRSLVLGSTGMEWEISSAEGAFSAKTAKVTPQSYRGSAALRALVVDNTIIHITRAGNQVRDFKYDFGSDSYMGTDRTVLAQHLFTGRHLLSWAYQAAPDSVIWAIRDDGVLLGMTYQAEHEVFAWHQHNTQGAFRALGCIPHHFDDELFVVTQRNGKGPDGASDGRYFLELFAPRYHGGDVSSAVFLDCALVYEGAPVNMLGGLEHLEGQTVGILADGAAQAFRQVKEGRVLLDAKAGKVIVGLPYTADMETMPLEVAGPEGASVGRKKYVHAVNVLFQDTITAKVGADFTRMEEYRARSVEAYGSSPAPWSGPRRFVLAGHGTNTATVCVRSDKPLPMTVLALMPELDVK